MNKRVYKAPEKVYHDDFQFTVFLAGSIEMGKAVDWRTELTNKILENEKLNDLIVINPRRESWDSTWIQSIENEQFAEQVNWELDYIEHADFIVFYFDPNTQSPITLLELGKTSGNVWADVIVMCPEGYFRKGNVDIVCQRYGMKQTDSLDGIVKFLENNIYKR